MKRGEKGSYCIVIPNMSEIYRGVLTYQRAFVQRGRYLFVKVISSIRENLSYIFKYDKRILMKFIKIFFNVLNKVIINNVM